MNTVVSGQMAKVAQKFDKIAQRMIWRLVGSMFNLLKHLGEICLSSIHNDEKQQCDANRGYIGVTDG